MLSFVTAICKLSHLALIAIIGKLNCFMLIFPNQETEAHGGAKK